MSGSRPHDWLGDGFLRSLHRVPNRPALEIGADVLTYAALGERVAGLLDVLGDPEEEQSPLTALFASRSAATYAGILAILFRGQGYVPLAPKFPTERLAYMLSHAGCRAMIVDDSAMAGLDALLDAADTPLKVVLAERDDVSAVAARHPRHDIRAGQRHSARALSRPERVQADDLAYLLFTSGSTGRPKGVMNTHANVAHFLRVMSARFDFTEADRFSQMFELGFDPSVFDLFVAWDHGASLVCPDRAEIMLPGNYIRRTALTVWSSVPSIAAVLNRVGQLTDGAFEGLHYSLFCGEALPTPAARAWQRAAPNAILENLYGPTECTIYCTGYRMNGSEDPFGSVPMGHAFPGLEARVVDANLCDVPPGGEGELLISGPQVALGYWRDREKTDASFIVDPETGVRTYRTGDLVRRSPDPDGPMTFAGRIDNQIKLHGQRVELGEVEAVLLEISRATQVVVIGWPMTPQGIGGLAAFLETAADTSAEVTAAARRRLPPYMVPKIVRTLPEFPLNPNGKVDRRALTALLNDAH